MKIVTGEEIIKSKLGWKEVNDSTVKMLAAPPLSSEFQHSSSQLIQYKSNRIVSKISASWGRATEWYQAVTSIKDLASRDLWFQ